MCCLFGCLGGILARGVLVLMYLNGYLERAYESAVWPFLGFLFLPLSTIFYAWTINSHGAVDGLYTVGLTLAVLADLGVFASSRDSD
ncbi:MAG: hypothetical protein JNN27_24090 [Planctomycetes bacterium]|nr:hypothetical protein [Planctomycetota bacterium]